MQAGAVADGGGEQSARCPSCSRVFASFGGRRVHERRAHPESFHAAEVGKLKAKPGAKIRWDPEELARMAEFEAVHQGARNINKMLRDEVLPGRTIESIKGARRTEFYKSLVLRSLRPRTVDDVPELRGRDEPGADGIASTSLGEAVQGRSPPTREAVRRELNVLGHLIGLDIPESVDSFLTTVNGWTQPGEYNYRAPRVERGLGTLNARQVKKKRYMKAQKLWRDSRGGAVRAVLEGKLDAVPTVPEGTQHFWANLFGRESVPDDRVPSAVHPPLDVLGPIGEEEVESVIRSSKSDTAAGPDKRDLRVIKALGSLKLRWLFNSLLWLGEPPVTWALGRTTLIPKTAEPKQPGDFRPITIMSLFLRLYHKILARRLMKAAPLPTEQKGFAPGEGVAANICLVQEMIRNAKSSLDPLCLAFIDFRKAFDSISHPSLLKAAKRWGLPTELIEYIRKLYENASTDIMGQRVGVRRGVLQGDPLSPYLFNITLDWVLSSLPSSVGVTLEGERLNYLAYADDVVLSASTAGGLQAALNVLVEEAGKVGLELGHNKCAVINLMSEKRRKRWLVDTSTVFTAGGVPIRCLNPGESYTYLGLECGPTTSRAAARRRLASYIEDLGKLQRAPFKPQQKLWALKQVLIPMHQYSVVLLKPSKGLLRRLDVEGRKFLKKALHLPKDTPDPAFYTKVRDGGLGVPCFLDVVSQLRAGICERLATNKDRRVARIAEAIPREGIPSKTLKASAAKNQRAKLYASVDGRGLSEAAESPPCHGWVSDGSLLIPSHAYINCLRVRLAVAPTRLRCSRGRVDAPVNCDLGCQRPESLGHILQMCPILAPERTGRHDRLLTLLASRLASKGLQVVREPSIRTSAGLRKPDLVLWDDRRSVVLDVQVTADSSVGASLFHAHTLKVRYYNTEEIRAWVRGKTGHEPVVTTLTINWRGIIANPSAFTLQDLGLSQRELMLLAVRSLEGSVQILRAHRDIGGHGGHSTLRH